MSKEAALRSSEADILLLQKLRGVGPAFATVLTRGFLPILRQPSSVRQLRSAIGTSRFSSLSVGRHLLRNRPELGAEVRTDDLATTTAARSRPSNRWHPDEMIGRIRRLGNVSPACCRPRGRSPRRAGSAPPRRPGRLTVDTKAGQELGFAPKL